MLSDLKPGVGQNKRLSVTKPGLGQNTQLFCYKAWIRSEYTAFLL